jgi:hypothetical protein
MRRYTLLVLAVVVSTVAFVLGVYSRFSDIYGVLVTASLLALIGSLLRGGYLWARRRRP